MLKMQLAHQINRFYKQFAEVIDRTPFHTKVRDLKAEGFLLDVQFDVQEVLEAYFDQFNSEAYAVGYRLNKLNDNITAFRKEYDL